MWCNASAILGINKGWLSKAQRQSCTVQTANKKRKADGKVVYSGNRFLKGTQPLGCSLGSNMTAGQGLPDPFRIGDLEAVA